MGMTPNAPCPCQRLVRERKARKGAPSLDKGNWLVAACRVFPPRSSWSPCTALPAGHPRQDLGGAATEGASRHSRVVREFSRA